MSAESFLEALFYGPHGTFSQLIAIREEASQMSAPGTERTIPSLCRYTCMATQSCDGGVFAVTVREPFGVETTKK